MSVAFSLDGRRIVSGSADKTIRIWDAEADWPVSGFPRSVIFAHPYTENRAGSDTLPDLLWNAGSSTLPRGFHLDHSDGWASSQYLMSPEMGSNIPLLFWVPPHNRRGICGSETIAIVGTPLNRLDFCRFMHGSSWTQCYLPPPTTKPSLIPPEISVLPRRRSSSLPLRILGFLLLLLGILNWLAGVQLPISKLS